MKIFMVFTEKNIFVLISLCFSASDVITNVAKQNRNIMTSTLSAYYKERKKYIFRQMKLILIAKCSLLSKNSLVV